MDKENQAAIDASPVVADVRISGQWRTVLLCSPGRGGESLFCLDVTDPENPLLLWELAGADLYRSRSWPALPRIGRIAWAGKKTWAAFIPSGDGIPVDSDPFLFILDLADGSVLEKVCLHADLDLDMDGTDDGLGGVPAGQPAIVDSDGNGYVDRIYEGTDKGFMFKIDIPDDPDVPGSAVAHCVINTGFTYTDVHGFTRIIPVDRRFQPIWASPSVVVDHDEDKDGNPRYSVRVFFSAFDGLDDHAVNRPGIFYAYVDHNDKGECHALKVALSWIQTIPPGHGVIGSPFAAAGTVFFGTSPMEAENPVTGKCYAVDMETGQVRFEQEAGHVTSALLVTDEHLYFKTRESGAKDPVILGSGKYNHDLVRTPDAPAGFQAWKELWATDAEEP